MESLYSWVFWCNHNEGLWYAIHRDHHTEFFSYKEKRKPGSFYKAKSIDDLIKYLSK